MRSIATSDLWSQEDPIPLHNIQTIPNNSKQFQTIPNNSKQFQTIPNNSKQFQTIPNNSKQITTIHNISQCRPQVLRLLREAGCEGWLRDRPGSGAVAALSGDSNCHDLPSQSSACLQTRGQVRGQGLAERWGVSCQILPAFAIFLQAVFNKLAKFMPDQTEKITKDTMSCPFLHSNMNHFSPPASTNSLAESLNNCSLEDNVDKFLTTDVTKPKASKVPLSWHTNRHTVSVMFFLATGSAFLEQEVGAPYLEGGETSGCGKMDMGWFPVRPVEGITAP